MFFVVAVTGQSGSNILVKLWFRKPQTCIRGPERPGGVAWKYLMNDIGAEIKSLAKNQCILCETIDAFPKTCDLRAEHPVLGGDET